MSDQSLIDSAVGQVGRPTPEQRAVDGEEIRRLRASNQRRNATAYEGIAIYGGPFPDDPNRYGVDLHGQRTVVRTWFAFQHHLTKAEIGQAPHDTDAMDSLLEEMEERYDEAPVGVYCLVKFEPTERPGGGRGKFGLLTYAKLIGDEKDLEAWLAAEEEADVLEEAEAEVTA